MAPDRLRDDAIAIWQAGVDAVKPSRLFQDRLVVEPRGSSHEIRIEGTPQSATEIPTGGQIYIFGGGKAGAAMAASVERRLLDGRIPAEKIHGWVNVPAGFSQRLERVHLHAARPLGLNEPTEAAIHGTREMLRSIAKLGTTDVGIGVISGGGSALICDPVQGITLEDKLATTRLLSELGASIHELNCVRTCLSRVKGGGLARRFRGGALMTLIISDVLGDPVETIASGPTVPRAVDYPAAQAVLKRYDPGGTLFPEAVTRHLFNAQQPSPVGQIQPAQLFNQVLGNIDVATEAARKKAESLGYRSGIVPVDLNEGSAEDTGARLASDVDRMAASGGRRCLIHGGEPTVKLVAESERGLGGRNQQLVLAALRTRLQREALSGHCSIPFALLSGGTDGEDGPTNAAGASISDHWMKANKISQSEVQQHLDRNDAYHFFKTREGLLISGPTDTNVCDLRVVLVEMQ